MKQCPKCHASINDTAKFCMECGCNIRKYEEEHAKPKVRFCPECGTEIPQGSFCPECGYNVEGGNRVEATASQADVFGDDWLSDLESTTSADVKNLKAQQTQAQTKKAFAMFDYQEHADGTYTITKLNDKSALIICVPQGVVNIAERAFEGSQMLQVVLPEGLMMIGKRAFAGCKYIEEIKLPATLRVVGEEAFADCVSLRIEIRNVSNVGKDAIKNTRTHNALLAEQERRQNEARKAEEARRAEEERRQAQARRAAEEKRVAEVRRAEEERRKEEERQAEARIQSAALSKVQAFENEKRLQSTIRREGEFVYFGAYPQRLYKGMRAISSKPTDEQGYYIYESSSTIKRCAFSGEFSHKMPYIVEPIKWRILSEDNEILYLMSTKALDARIFSQTNNNYENSDIRAWLNDVFFKKAFLPDAQSKICELTCNNSAATTDSSQNPYACENTKDMVSLITFCELRGDYGYGFSSPYEESLTRTVKYTEYAFSNAGIGGLMQETETEWWTRSPSSHHRDFVLGVNKQGKLQVAGPFSSDTIVLRANEIKGIVPIIKVYKK